VEKSPTPRVAAPNIRPFTCYEIIAMHPSEMHPLRPYRSPIVYTPLTRRVI